MWKCKKKKNPHESSVDTSFLLAYAGSTWELISILGILGQSSVIVVLLTESSKLWKLRSCCHINTWWLIGQQLLFSISDHKKPFARASRFGGSLSVEPPGGRARPWPQIGCCVFQCPNACPSSLTGHPGLPGMKVSEISDVISSLRHDVCLYLYICNYSFNETVLLFLPAGPQRI